MIKFLLDYSAAFITDKKILLIADLHLGIEYQLFKSGIVVPPQVEKFKKILYCLIKQAKAKTLIILGDLKAEVPGISPMEEREIPKLFDYLEKKD